jgi:hypothetical protein
MADMRPVSSARLRARRSKAQAVNLSEKLRNRRSKAVESGAETGSANEPGSRGTDRTQHDSEFQ